LVFNNYVASDVHVPHYPHTLSFNYVYQAMTFN